MTLKQLGKKFVINLSLGYSTHIMSIKYNTLKDTFKNMVVV